MRLRKPTRAAAAGVALAAFVAGGTAYAATALTAPARSVPAAAEGGGMKMGSFSDNLPFDAQFLDQMSVHHQGAIMSTQAMIAGSARPEMRDLAQDIIANQTAELEQMQTWRAQWYPDIPPTFAMANSMMGEGSMMGDGSMLSQPGTGGSTMDRMYLQMMIRHHQLAVDMAEQAQREARHPQLRELAQAMAAHQAEEIDRMRGYLTSQSADAEN